VIDYIWYSHKDFSVESVLGGFFKNDKIPRDVVRHLRETDPPPAALTPTSNPIDVQTDSLILPRRVRYGRQQSFSDLARPPADRPWSVEGSGMFGFPNAVFPSDHIPVVCTLRLIAPDQHDTATASTKHRSGKRQQ
jgi:hypothetical protein